MRIFYFVVLLLITALGAVAQDRSGLYITTLNPVVYNPAHMGTLDHLVVNTGGRIGFDNTSNLPKNAYCTVHSPVSPTDAIGVRFLADKRGGYNIFNVEGAYSKDLILETLGDKVVMGHHHHHPSFKHPHAKHLLKLGISAGATQFGFQPSVLNAKVDQSDPTLNTMINTRFTAGMGLVYYYKNLIEFGLSSPYLFSSGEKLAQFQVANLAGNIVLSDGDMKFRPWVSYYNIYHTKDIFESGLKGTFVQKVSGQILYRTNKSVTIGAGYMNKNIQVQYAYTFLSGPFAGFQSGYNELSVDWFFAKPFKKKRG